MQPTMKLRLFQPENGIPKGVPFITDSYGRCYVFQQWQEQTVSIPIDGVVTEQVIGDWFDVPIEVES